MADKSEPARPNEPILDAEGHFHVTDAPIELGHYLIEDWASPAFFWLLGACVLLGASVGGELLNPGAPELLTVFDKTGV